MFSVIVSNERFWFSSAHFLGGEGYFECVHGHNFKVTVEIFGSLNQQKMVLDFLKLSPIISKIVNSLDHKLIIGKLNSNLQIRDTGKEIILKVKNSKKNYIFPSNEVILLSISNGTIEEIAKYIANRIKKAIHNSEIVGYQKLSILSVEITECPWRLAKYQTSFNFYQPEISILQAGDERREKTTEE